MQEKLIEFCRWLEPLIRPLGWHCAATGSALYGLTDIVNGEPREPEDIDVLLYRHNGYVGTTWRPFDALIHAGIREIADCTEYPDFIDGLSQLPKERNRRKVFKVEMNGVKIDFLCIDELL